MRRLYDVGGMRLDAQARVLTHEGASVALGPRAVAVLAVLVSRPNEAITKAEIMDAAWPGLVVEEANLAVQISALRRALARVPGGEGWIETLARRGYRFVGPVAPVAGTAADALAPKSRRKTNLPQVSTSFVGRELEIAQIKQLLPAARLITLTGTGGIGKTRLALQAVAEMSDSFAGGVWFVDLAPLSEPSLVVGALARVLSLKEQTGQSLLVTVCQHLRAAAHLLVLDNCEHLLGAVAELADALLRDTQGVTVLATSRQALQVANERVHPVKALAVPEAKATLAAIARKNGSCSVREIAAANGLRAPNYAIKPGQSLTLVSCKG